jgi:hypothetical protein
VDYDMFPLEIIKLKFLKLELYREPLKFEKLSIERGEIYRNSLICFSNDQNDKIIFKLLISIEKKLAGNIVQKFNKHDK